MRRSIARVLIVVSLATVGLFATALPAQAATCPTYSNWFTGGTDWGRWRWCSINNGGVQTLRVQVDDNKTDGFAVHIAMCSAEFSGVPDDCVSHGSQAFTDDFYFDDPDNYCVQSVGAPVNVFDFLMPLDPGHTDIQVIRGGCSPHTSHINSATFWTHWFS